MEKKAEKIDFAIGGQAVIEGVMMRSPNFWVVSVRDEKGKIHTKQTSFNSLIHKMSFLNLPLIRGIVHLAESMNIGFKALDYSNDVFLGEHEKELKHQSFIMKLATSIFTIIYVLGTLAFTLFLVKFIPLWIAGKLAEFLPLLERYYLLFNAVDGIVKILIFISYILLISLLKDIRRVFQYHGAEHKSIRTYEQGLKLNIENARKQSRFHPRCGTSFIFIVILMSILVYTVLPPAESFQSMLALRIAVIPLIAGVSYEFLKISSKKQNNPIMRLLSLPGLWIQKLTTKEPTDEQLEVALHALKSSLKAEDSPLL